MLTKEQASVAADQLVVDARSHNDRKALARLEERGGPIPRGMSLDQFWALVERGQSRLWRTWQFAGLVVAWMGLVTAEGYFHASALIVSTSVVGALVIRLVTRKLVAKFVRENARSDA
jgi:hypothetical protein